MIESNQRMVCVHRSPPTHLGITLFHFNLPLRLPVSPDRRSSIDSFEKNTINSLKSDNFSRNWCLPLCDRPSLRVFVIFILLLPSRKSSSACLSVGQVCPFSQFYQLPAGWQPMMDCLLAAPLHLTRRSNLDAPLCI